MSTLINKVIPNRKLKVRIIKDGFSSPILGYPNYIGKIVILNATTAKRFIDEGVVELVEENKGAEPEQEPSEKATLDEAIAALDHDDDAHWTKGGLPDLNVLKEMTGRVVKRDEVPESVVRDQEE